MHNYRGFTKTLVPLEKANFLVGENSTGKSSFLQLLQLVSRPNFWFFPRFTLADEDVFGGYADIVSAWAKNKSFFDVGVVNTKRNKAGQTDIEYSVHRFVEKGANPALGWHLQVDASKQTLVRFSARGTQYSVLDCNCTFGSEQAALASFLSSMDRLADPAKLKPLPKTLPPNPPLALVISLLRAIERGAEVPKNEFKAEVPMMMNLSWIAPIRNRPQRIYDGLTRAYSAEGAHSPFVLRKQLKSKRFATQLAAFGVASGLFETVATHTFGKGQQNPFEVLIRFKGADLNINNVGYGVSQALPLVIEFLARAKDHAFAVQQPEVHLHPKAQAALGALVFEVAVERGHTFLIETHSDYLIDRYRLTMSKSLNPPTAQVLFFERTDIGNTVSPIRILPTGRYQEEQPPSFRSFFLHEEMSLLSL
jgi:predicted ATPase